MRRVLPLAGAVLAGGAAIWFFAGSRPLPVAEPIVVDRSRRVTVDTLQPGETISELLAQNGVSGLRLERFSDETDLHPRRLRAGLAFSFTTWLPDVAPSVVSVEPDHSRVVNFVQSEEGWRASIDSVEWSSELVRVEGPIENSLYLALEGGLPDSMLDLGQRTRLAWELAEIYAWTVDFTRDIRPGDHYRVVFEREVSERGEVRFGRVLASDLTVTGTSLPAFRFVHDDGRQAFYDDQGRSLRRAFLRYPVQFRRISSRYSTSRVHPILGRRRQHHGVDYAADRGTRVVATADGVVKRVWRSSSYGNIVELRHKNGITTRYAHLNGYARGIRAGVRVSQGDPIGYVGMTGLATAPHLHYEFRVNNVPRNPLSIDMGSGDPISQADRPAFEAEVARLQPMLGTEREVLAQGDGGAVAAGR